MTRDEYADYEKRFAEGMRDYEHFSSGTYVESCDDCPKIEDSEHYAEPYFSWHRCEICESTLGGDRYDCHAFYIDSMVHLRVCTDCVYYAEYGHLDDKTMAEVESA